MNDIKADFLHFIMIFFDKMPSVKNKGTRINSENQQLATELQKSIIKIY